jgi:hypothetical protein
MRDFVYMSYILNSVRFRLQSGLPSRAEIRNGYQQNVGQKRYNLSVELIRCYCFADPAS